MEIYYNCTSPLIGFLGCSVDVLHLLAKACSGKQVCSYPVLSNELHETQPCIKEVASYLSVEYDCIKGKQV